MVFTIVFSIVGVYCVFNGIKTILTGKLSAREEDKLQYYSQKGARLYKLFYAIFNIIGGLLIIGLGVIRFLESQGILGDIMIFNIIALGVVVVMALILALVNSKCKKMSDDE